jgi:hypothetical protein
LGRYAGGMTDGTCWSLCSTFHRTRSINPVERIWAALKAALAYSPTLAMAGRVRQVHALFRTRSPARLLATAAPTAHPGSPTDTDRTFGRPLSARAPPS